MKSLWSKTERLPDCQNVGIGKHGRLWYAIDLEDAAQIGMPCETKEAAMNYARYRQNTTYSPLPTTPHSGQVEPFTKY